MSLFYLFIYLFVCLFVYLFIYLWLRLVFSAAHGLSLAAAKGGLLFVVVHGLLIAVASRCRSRALGAWASVVVPCGLSSCGLQALEGRICSSGAWA